MRFLSQRSAEIGLVLLVAAAILLRLQPILVEPSAVWPLDIVFIASLSLLPSPQRLVELLLVLAATLSTMVVFHWSAPMPISFCFCWRWRRAAWPNAGRRRG